MIEFASDKDTGEIRALWDIAFPQEPDFNDWFFANKYKAELCLVYKEDGIIMAMAQLLPYEIKGVGKVSYVYGAATHPNYRRQGLMRRLLNRSFETDKEKGFAASILIPQDKPLFDFYKGLGYKTCFFAKSGIACGSADTKGYGIREASEADIPFMDRLYRTEQGENYIIRTKDYWAEQIKMFKALGGGTYILMKGETPRGYGFVSDGFIQEAFGDGERLAALAGVNKYVSCGGDMPIGMAYSYGNKLPDTMYINLMYN